MAAVVSTGSEDIPTYKVTLLGESGVGKTQIANRFVNDEFSEETVPTIGVGLSQSDSKHVTVDGERVAFQLWDSAGQERFRAITQSYYRDAAGVMIVYDITRRASFEAVGGWLDEVHRHGGRDTVVLLIGNKLDLDHLRRVPHEEAQALAEEHNLGFLETSAKDATGVQEAFQRTAEDIVRSRLRESPTHQSVERVRRGVAFDEPAQGARRCC